MEERYCLDCGDKLIGRADKKFCNDICRNNYNNNLKRDINNYMRKVDEIIKKNRRILESLNPIGKAKTHKDKLIAKGFDFNYFTNIYTTKTGNIYHFCYEQGYLSIGNDYYAIVKREEYLN